MTEPVPATPTTTDEPTRRSFLYKAFTATVAGAVGLFPAIAGLLFFLDPLRKRKAAAAGGGGKEGFIKVGQLDAVPHDGTPVRFTVIVDRREDAWTTYLNVPVGAVYVRRAEQGRNEIVAFNVTCPHLGCAVDYLPGRKQYLCPCHDSAFALDGKRTNQTPPRDLDTLEVDTAKLEVGEVWVKYQDFRTGEEHKVVKT
jgi:menaquinol-cytochrome c reductase iron-sulfur subunit